MVTMRQPNTLLSIAAFYCLLSVSPANAQSVHDNNRHTGALNDGLIAYVNQDYSVALRLLEPLAEKNDPLAQLFVGRMLAKGQGASQNCEHAIDWLTRAAQGGNAEAAFDLASFSEKGYCVPHSISRALAWYQIAAANGDICAPNAIGEIYLNREYVGADPQKAIFWFERGVMLFDPAAYHHLGDMFAKGEGGSKDLIEAYKWFDLAAGLEFAPDSIYGETTAAVARAKVGEQLTPAQVTEAQKRASRFGERFIQPADRSSKLSAVSSAILHP